MFYLLVVSGNVALYTIYIITSDKLSLFIEIERRFEKKYGRRETCIIQFANVDLSKIRSHTIIHSKTLNLSTKYTLKKIGLSDSQIKKRRICEKRWFCSVLDSIVCCFFLYTESYCIYKDVWVCRKAVSVTKICIEFFYLFFFYSLFPLNSIFTRFCANLRWKKVLSIQMKSNENQLKNKTKKE